MYRYHSAPHLGAALEHQLAAEFEVPQRPPRQRSRDRAHRHHPCVPHEHMQRLKIGTMKLQHRCSAQAGECAARKSRRNDIYRKATSQKPPAQQGGGNNPVNVST